MIGTTLEARPGPPIGVWGLVAVLSAAACSLFEIAGLLAVAAISAIIAITLFVSRERPFAARVEPNALVHLHSGEVLPYTEIESLVVGTSGGAKNPYQYAIDLRTATKIVRIPASIDVPTAELERFLRSHLPPRLVGVPDPDVDEYLNRQMEQFGPQRVHWYSAAKHPAAPARTSVRRAWLAMFLAGLVVMIVGAVMLESKTRGPRDRAATDQYTGVAVVGTIALVVGLLGVLIHIGLTQRTHPKVKNIELSSLVISPVGIALRQGDLKGELKWEEIRGVKLPRNKSLSLQLAGVTIQIVNIYDRSLVEIHHRIRELGRFPG